MDKYKTLIFIFKFQNNILSRINKETSAVNINYNKIIDIFKISILRYVLDDMINLICESFEHIGVKLTKKDFYREISKSRHLRITTDDDFIREFYGRYTYFENILRDPINYCLYWDNTSFCWSTCNKASNNYKKLFNKYVKI